ncbi:unnamed protein product [Chironomus riparius]|uniref:Uncharacterized protein n=1 Tax=Chironomus riparius TaxID=315576 RepID=A0A9N9S3K7_9DIPT|nr:unnamed protein product [Chironomus riparius]
MKFDVQKYFKISTIHGFCYISRQYHIVERIFWTIALACSVVCSLFLISTFVIKLLDLPTIVYLSDKAVPISAVDFPAVTICPDFLPYHPYDFNSQHYRYEKHTAKVIKYGTQEYLNETTDENKIGIKIYTKILNGIEKGELDIHKFGLKLLKRLQVVDMITNQGLFAKINLSIPNDDFLSIINEFSKEFLKSASELNVFWMEDQKQYVSEILTSEGLCLTFNIAFSKDLLQLKRTSNDFHCQLFHLKYFSDSSDLVPPKTLPRKISSSFSGLQMKFDVIKMLFDDIFERNPHSLVFYIHDPYELPSSNSKMFNLDATQRTKITIDAELNTIDDSIVDYTPIERNCYLDSEKRLKFFKKYTIANCIQECLTDFMIKSCGCAEFFMIRNVTTRICSASEEECYLSARNGFLSSQSDCGCLSPCNHIKYKLESNQMDLDRYNYYTEEKKLELNMSFKKDNINHFIHKQLYDVLDLLSYAGGLLGLFAGFSLLSFIELIYWFTVRAIMKNFHQSTRVHPFNENQDSQRNFMNFKHVAQDFLKNSSIHGLRYISKRKIIDKIFWSILIGGSTILGLLMISKTNEKIPNSHIISYDDSLKFKGNVIFPAITIIPEITIHNDFHKMFMMFGDEDQNERVAIKMKNQTYKNDVIRLFSKFCTCFKNCVPIEYFDDELFHDFTSDAKKLMQSEPETVWFQAQFSTFNEIINPVYAEIRTQLAMGYTFNIIDTNKLLNFKSINQEFQYFKNVTTKAPDNIIKTARNISVRKGTGAILKMKLKSHKLNSTEGLCKLMGLLIHDIDALPTFFKRDDIMSIAPGRLDVEVIPEIIKTDIDMKKIDSSVRKCYFDGEKSLKYFNKYSQKNCIIECLTNFTLSMCNCTDPSQPFEIENFCHQDFYDHNIYCPSQAVQKFESQENVENSCECIPTCDSITYHVKYSYKFAKDDDEIEINLRLNSEDAILFRRYQLFTFSDVVSYVGGLLGLLAGISMLSIVEFFYYFFIRVLIDIYRF